jgi:hypothetical protein
LGQTRFRPRKAENPEKNSQSKGGKSRIKRQIKDIARAVKVPKKIVQVAIRKIWVYARNAREIERRERRP